MWVGKYRVTEVVKDRGAFIFRVRVGPVHTAVRSRNVASSDSGIRVNQIPYILESNPHPFYSFRGLKNQMRIRFAVVSWILEK